MTNLERASPSRVNAPRHLAETYGPWALIAGASEGIGAAFAEALAAQGFSLILLARRREPLEQTADALRARYGTSIETHALDLGDSDLENTLRALSASHDIGLVVYNAALSIVAPFACTTLADKQRMIDVNVRGPLTTAHVFAERMTARPTEQRGGIILMSSLTAFWGSAWVATYGATKAFNLSLGEALAEEFSAQRIDVVVSCAGATATPGFIAQVAGRKGPTAMPPRAVADETLRALRHRNGMFVPGRFNRFAQFLLSRVLPRRTSVRLMAAQTRALIRT